MQQIKQWELGLLSGLWNISICGENSLQSLQEYCKIEIHYFGASTLSKIFKRTINRDNTFGEFCLVKKLFRKDTLKGTLSKHLSRIFTQSNKTNHNEGFYYLTEFVQILLYRLFSRLEILWCREWSIKNFSNFKFISHFMQ